ncbi:branched-chain amino acid ABC transporter permease [Actinomadura rudentiformis]|uniref:ABC transporter permease n=1 Tax=Actinomadura rudentiformis TaxID=359158 RepID=A0A6H9YA97_9ACTN|nr:ABC transporter permease [Actinomadura rudentiformis]KAB2341538.1 ABC transporter permease [Actinomadura rudentiformis]
MTTFLTYTALGLVLGAVYAIAASGLVLTYTTSGIFNFAHGAQAMVGAFTYYQFTVAWKLPAWAALIMVVGLLGPAMGRLQHAFIMRGLRDTEQITRIVVTVAIMLGLVALAQWLWDPQEARVPQMLFGVDRTITFFGVTLRYHEVICLFVALALAVGLRALFVKSRLGVLMRATVDDPDLLSLTSHDPDRVSAQAWMLGSTLAVLAGVLITPVIGGPLEANALTLLVIDAFAAALFGRLKSIPLTFLGAIVLGLMNSYLVGYAPAGWSWVGNLRQSLAMIVLFVILLLFRNERLRGAATRSRERYEVPPVRRAVMWGAVFVLAVMAFRQLIDASSVGLLQLGIAFAVIALSQTLLTGYAGELNLAPLAFSAIATIAAFHTGIHGEGLEARLSLGGVVVGVIAAAVTGAIVAVPALRLRGLYLALATLAFGVFVSSMILRDIQEHTLFGRTFAIFPNGNLLFPRLALGPVDLADDDVFLLVSAALFAGLGVGLVALRNGGYGRRLAAMKDSPAACAMLGQRLLWLKLSVFAISTAIAGLGGILMSMSLTSVTKDHFVFTVSLSLVMLAVVGGIGYVSGALFSGLVAGAGLTAVVALLNNAATERPEFDGALGVVSHLVLVSAALTGVGVAQNPSGILHDVFARHRTLAKAPEIRYGAIVAQCVLYAFAWSDVLGTTSFVVLSLILWLCLPQIGAALRPAKILGDRPARATPPELVGIDSDYPSDLASRLDKRLGIEEGVARVIA